MLIAAHAVALGCTLITDNEADFRRIGLLSLENWLRRR
jgi:tRNA(fMet)-specific endonuclease VapC